MTHAAAKRFLEAAGYQEHEIESARRHLTELLLDAKQQTDPRVWRTRKRSTKLDISAIVEHEGRAGHAPSTWVRRPRRLDSRAADAHRLATRLLG